MADDDEHAERIAERLYRTCEFWPTPRHVQEAAVIERRTINPPTFACSRCFDTGMYLEWIERDGARYKKPGTEPQYCDCPAGVERKASFEQRKQKSPIPVYAEQPNADA